MIHRWGEPSVIDEIEVLIKTNNRVTYINNEKYKERENDNVKKKNLAIINYY